MRVFVRFKTLCILLRGTECEILCRWVWCLEVVGTFCWCSFHISYSCWAPFVSAHQVLSYPQRNICHWSSPLLINIPSWCWTLHNLQVPSEIRLAGCNTTPSQGVCRSYFLQNHKINAERSAFMYTNFILHFGRAYCLCL